MKEGDIVIVDLKTIREIEPKEVSNISIDRAIARISKEYRTGKDQPHWDYEVIFLTNVYDGGNGPGDCFSVFENELIKAGPIIV